MKMGTYTQRQLSNRTFKKYIRKNKHNRTYNGGLTIREAKKQAIVLCLLLIGMSVAGFYQYLTVNYRSIAIINDATVQAIAPVETHSEREIISPSADEIRAVMVEPEMQEILKYQWKRITPQQVYDLIECESNFRNIKNLTSTASGKLQFTEGTWQDGVKARNLDWTLNDRFDFTKAINMAHYFVEKKNQLSRWECAKILNLLNQ